MVSIRMAPMVCIFECFISDEWNYLGRIRKLVLVGGSWPLGVIFEVPNADVIPR